MLRLEEIYPLSLATLPPLYQADGGVTPGCEWCAEGKGKATSLPDAEPVLLFGGALYATDGDRWQRAEGLKYMEALRSLPTSALYKPPGLYDLVGPAVRGNPYDFDRHTLLRRGNIVLKTQPPRDADGLRDYFAGHPIYGVAWYYTQKRAACVTRTQFGLTWPPGT